MLDVASLSTQRNQRLLASTVPAELLLPTPARLLCLFRLEANWGALCLESLAASARQPASLQAELLLWRWLAGAYSRAWCLHRGAAAWCKDLRSL